MSMCKEMQSIEMHIALCDLTPKGIHTYVEIIIYFYVYAKRLWESLCQQQ